MGRRIKKDKDWEHGGIKRKEEDNFQDERQVAESCACFKTTAGRMPSIARYP